MRRVVITAVGLVSPLGNTKQALWEGLSSAHSGVVSLADGADVDTIARFGAPCRQFSGEIDDFGGLEKEQKKAIRKGLKVMCRECQMGVAAAQLALADAGLKLGMLDPTGRASPSAPTTCSRCPRRLPKASSSASTGKAGSISRVGAAAG